MLSPYEMLQESTGDPSSSRLVSSSCPPATHAEWQRDPASVAGYFARIKEVEVAACVEMQRLKEQGSVERCRITEEHRSRRYDRWADTAKATASEDASTHREAIAANRDVAQQAISTSAWIEESQARSRGSQLPGPGAWPWSALAANLVLWGGLRRVGLRSWRGAVVWLVVSALALRKARQALASKWGSLTWSPSQALAAVLRPALRALGGGAPGHAGEGEREQKQRGARGRLALTGAERGGEECAPADQPAALALAGAPLVAAPDAFPAVKIPLPAPGASEALPGLGALAPSAAAPSQGPGLPAPGAGEPVSAQLEEWGLGAYVEALDKHGYTDRVLRLLEASDQEEMFGLVGCSAGHRVLFRRLLASLRALA